MIKKFLEGLYPLTKLYFAISLIISAFLIPNDFYGYVLVIVCGILASSYGKGSAYFKRVFISLFLLTLVIFAAQSTLFASKCCDFNPALMPSQIFLLRRFVRLAKGVF